MTIHVRPTQSGNLLQVHERRVLDRLKTILDEAQEEGILLPGIFLVKDDYPSSYPSASSKKKTAPVPIPADQEKVAEVDSVLVYPNMVLLLELKSRDTNIITIADMNGPLMLGTNEWHEDKTNPLSVLAARVKRPLASKLDTRNIKPIIVSIFVADAYGQPFELRVGPEKKPYGALNSEAWACKAEDFLSLMGLIRQRFNEQPRFPLDEKKRTKLERLADAVQGILELKQAVLHQKLRKGTYIYDPKPVIQEAEFNVYQGHNPDTDKLIWVKEYLRDFLATGDQISQRHVIELRDGVALEKLGDHANIARYRQYRDEPDENAVYVFIEREAGQFLSQSMKANALSSKDKLSILRDILAGLAHIHSRGFVYRDLRPESIFVTSSGQAKLFNFDCTRIPGSLTVIDKAANRATRYMLYASCELLTATTSGDVQSPSDVYQWAVIAYELFTGTLPYARQVEMEGREQSVLDEARLIKGKFKRLAEFKLEIPETLVAVIEKSLVPDAVDRPSVAEIQNVLSAILAPTE